MSDPNKPSSLEDLDARLRQARGDRPGQVAPESDRGSNLGIAWQLAIEMASALAVGALIGWWLDRWLGTRPWFLIGFFLLGSASGMVSAFRAARRISQAANEGGDRGGKPSRDE